MILRPLDIVILLKLHVLGEEKPSQMKLAKLLHISSRSVNEGLKRATTARLYNPSRQAVNAHALADALIYGVRHFMPVEKGELAYGIPTAWAAPPLINHLSGSNELPPIWPFPEGTSRGISITPLHSSVPKAIENDQLLYEMLSLVDTLRIGSTRERGIAIDELKERLSK